MQQTGRIGFRVITGVPRPAAELVEQCRALSSTELADAAGRFHFMDPGIRPRTGLPLCGVAVTVNARPGDSLMVHKAVDLALPGDVIVVSTNGCNTSAVFGGFICRSAVRAGLSGLVVDGAIRDVADIAALSFAAFSRSVCVGAGDKDGPGEINVPISCGSTVVCPGDIVVGDEDGIAIVPLIDAVEIVAIAEAAVERERARIVELDAGVDFAADLDDLLRRRGVIP